MLHLSRDWAPLSGMPVPFQCIRRTNGNDFTISASGTFSLASYSLAFMSVSNPDEKRNLSQSSTGAIWQDCDSGSDADGDLPSKRTRRYP